MILFSHLIIDLYIINLLNYGECISYIRNHRSLRYPRLSGLSREVREPYKKITVNKNNGKVTIKKDLKKGTYKVKMKIRVMQI